MEKPKYLYKNSKCVGGTSSTVSLINAWISITSMTGQRNLQKYRSIAYLGGFTIIAFATIWFLSQSQTYAIKYDSKEKSKKTDKPPPIKPKKPKSDKRSKKNGWWSSIREKIANKLGFGKRSKSPKNQSTNIPSGPSKPGRSTGKKRTNGSTLSSKSPVKSPEIKGTQVGSRNENSSNTSIDNVQKEDQITQKILIESYGDSSPNSNKHHATQKIQVESYDGDNSSDLRQKAQRVESHGSNFISEIKQQSLRKLKLKVQEVRPSNWTNRKKLSRVHPENKSRLDDCSKSKHPEEVSPIHNVKCPTKSLCQDVDRDYLLTRIAEKIKKIHSIDLQDREKCKEFYIPYVPLTSHETFDTIGQERVEYYKKLLGKLLRQKQQDSELESMLRMVKEFFHEKKYYLPEDDDDFNEERADLLDELYDFFKKLEQNVASAEVTNKHAFVDVLAQVDEASRKRIEISFEILRMIDSYQQQGKETEANIKKSIEMFNKQRAQYKGITRCLKRPSTLYNELDQLKDRLMDTEQQVKNLVMSLDDMETYLTEVLELIDDDNKMNTAVARYGPILNTDEI